MSIENKSAVQLKSLNVFTINASSYDAPEHDSRRLEILRKRAEKSADDKSIAFIREATDIVGDAFAEEERRRLLAVIAGF
ncbi:MAG TPA: hypothetical protein VFA74_02920 [Terriglobales bacterium]|nr:hypothetical protein [Terriglobales bacterium]